MIQRHGILLRKREADFSRQRDVQVSTQHGQLEIAYHRPNGKISRQSYDTNPVELNFFLDAAERSQNYIYPKALLGGGFPIKTKPHTGNFTIGKASSALQKACTMIPLRILLKNGQTGFMKRQGMIGSF